jgi:RNA polymerase sigma factor (sigma-70 family)
MSSIREQPWQESDERDLVRRVKQGDDAAWKMLCDLYGPKLRGHISYLLRLSPWGMTDLEDLFQEAFLRLAKYREGLEEDKPIWPYLKVTAFNVFRSWYDKQKRSPRLDPLGPDNDPVHSSFERATVDERKKEIIEALKRCLDRLPADLQRVVRRHWLEGEPLDAITRSLGITLNQAKHRSSNGRSMLAECLKEFR